MKALVTGATGFIGSNLLRKLTIDGHEVHALTRGEPPESIPSVQWHKGDILKPSTLESAFSHSYDVVFHLAGLVSVDSRRKQELYAVNENGTRNVLEQCHKRSVGRVVHVSSIAAIGPAPDHTVADETTPFGWKSDLYPYHASKNAGQRVALEFAQNGLDVVVVNPGFVYGGGDDHTPARELLVKIKNRFLPLYPPGGMCNVYVEDLIRGFTLAAERGQPGEMYILGGDNMAHRDAYPIMAKALGATVPRFPLPYMALMVYGAVAELEGKLRRKPPRFSLMWARSSRHNHFYSSEKAMRELGYTFMDFKTMIKKTVSSLTDQGLL